MMTIKRPNTQELREMHATVCQALADPTRIALLYELGNGPKHVNELVDALELPQATVSRHLKMLRERSLVNTRREGAFIYYSLSDERVLSALDTMFAVKNDILVRQGNLVQSTSQTFERE